MTALVELNPIDPGTGSRVTLRVCASQSPDATGAAGFVWWPAIIAQPVLSMTLFDGAFSSAVSVAQASMEVRLDVLRNSGQFPRVERYDWSGATAVISRLVNGLPVQLAVMRVERFASEQDRLSLSLAVDEEPLQANVLFSDYAGTSGAEGTDDLRGKPKPWAFGRCVNVEPVFIDKVDNVYQVSGYGPVQAIPAVYERGASFGTSIGDFANYAALVAANIPEGRWGTCLAQGMFRLGAPPAGVITCDVDGDSTAGFIRRTGAIIKEIGRRLDVSGMINAASLDALDAAVARDVNIYVSQQTSLLDLARRMAAPCNAVAGLALDGRLIMPRVAFGAEQLTLDNQGRQMPPVLGMARKNTSPPFDEIKMGAARSWRVHSFDEIAFYDELIDRGAYDPATVYREGNIVTSPDQSRWVYINPTPTAGNAPPAWPTASNAFWSSLAPPLNPTAIGVEEGANRTQTANANRVPFSRMEGDKGWPLLFNPFGIGAAIDFGEFAGLRFVRLQCDPTGPGQSISFGQVGPMFKVQPGERLSVQARLENAGGAQGGWQLELWTFEPDGVTQSPQVISAGTGALFITNDLVQAFVTVPAGRVFGRIEFRVTSGGAGFLQAALSEPMVTSALPGQTIHPPFTPGPNAFDAADVTGENTAALVAGQSAWATWPGLTPAVLEAEVATARSDSSIALTALGNIAADNVLDIGEKQQVRQLRDAIVAEFPIWRDRGIEFDIPSVIRTAYQAAYDGLIAYLASVALDTNVNTAIDRVAFNAAFTNYFFEREKQIDGIAAVAAQRAIWASVTGTGRPEDNADVTAGKIAAGFAGQGPWATFVGQSPAALQADIANAQSDATIALTALNNIAADGVFDIGEKQQVRRLRDDIVIEFPIWLARAAALNVPIGIRNAYQTAYDNLIAFLTSVAIDSDVNTTMDRATFTARFNVYFFERSSVFDAITNAASQIATRLPLGNANRVPYSRMEGNKGWPLLFNGSGIPAAVGYGDFEGRRFVQLQANPTAAGQSISIGHIGPVFKVEPGERLSVQARLENAGGAQAGWQLELWTFAPDGVTQIAQVIAAGTGARFIGNDPVQTFVTVPAGRVFGRLEYRVTSGGAGFLQAAISEPMVTSAAAEQTVHPPFTAGPNADNGADVTVDQPVVGLLNPVTGRANSRRINSQIVASGILQTLNTNPLSASTSGGVSTITINAHDVFDDVGTLSFSSASIGGLSPSTVYYVYESNPDFVGGARTYVATTDRNALTVFGRRTVGFITTPADGGVSSGGGAGGGGWAGDPNISLP